MFGIGGFELFIILLFGFFIFGPERLPGIAKTIGNAISRFRNASSDMSKTLQNEAFDKDSAEPFKNPLDLIDNMTGGAVAATGATQVAKNGNTAKTIAATSPTKASADASSGETAEHAESFAERKARYDRERAERKAAEKKAAEQAAAEADAAAHADPVDDVADKPIVEAADPSSETPRSADSHDSDTAAADPTTETTVESAAAAQLETEGA